MSFTEFYADTATGSNINAGSTTGAATLTLTGGNWVQSTGVYTKAGANLSGITAGMFASVYIDGATLAVFIGRITAVDDTADTVTVSLTAKSGTAPTDGTGNRSITIGGVWKGPNGAEDFPFDFVDTAMTNSSGDTPRVNIKAGTYSITAGIAQANNGPIRFQGCTDLASPGDGGRFTVDGGTTNAVLYTQSGNNVDLVDAIIQTNATGNVNGITLAGIEAFLRRVVVNSVRRSGIEMNGANQMLIECECYSCNASNGAGHGGFRANSGSGTLIRCISHDNSGGNSAGFNLSGGTNTNIALDQCIADSNGGDGFNILLNGQLSMDGCDAYSNAGDGLEIANTAAHPSYIENCNFIKNGGWGINGSGSGARHGSVVNCGFGAGTQANTSGTTTGLKSMVESGTVTYASDVTPWVDPANGDFRITLSTAKGAGRGSFTQTAASYSGTVAYPDIGAAQHQDSGTGGSGGGHIIGGGFG